MNFCILSNIFCAVLYSLTLSQLITMKFYTYGTSRWTEPAKILNDKYNIPSKAYPGKDLEFITQRVIDRVKSDGVYDPKANPAFVYITAGLTDVTEKVTYGWDSNRYQEVIFYEDISKAVDRVMNEFHKSSHKLFELNGIMPVYSTVAPMSFWDWNYMRLCQGKTSALYHVEDYWVMQEDLEDCIIEINNRIREMNANISPHTLTPRIADQVFQKKGANQPHRFRHNRLVDGVHPDGEVVDKWVQEMVDTIDKNAETFLELEGHIGIL